MTVTGPAHLAATFHGTDFRVQPVADLTVSLRTHTAEHVQSWVAALLEGKLEDAATLSERMTADGFDLYVTDEADIAKDYVLRRYAGSEEKTYGLLASSKARNLREIGIDNEFGATQRMRIADWFNAPRDNPGSSCQLAQPATEFQAQGLELDLPIVCWGDDLAWADGEWHSNRRTRGARDSHLLRLNAYRVLLTRGRDGIVIFVPATLASGQQRAVLDVLHAAGARDLRTDLRLAW